MDRSTCIDFINSLLSERIVYHPDEAIQTIHAINSCFTHDLADTDALVLIALVFNPSKGILRFITNIADRKEHSDSLKGSFALLEYLIVNLTDYVVPHSKVFAQWVSGILFAPHSVGVKTEAIRAVNALFENSNADFESTEFLNIVKKLLFDIKTCPTLCRDLFRFILTLCRTRNDLFDDPQWIWEIAEKKFRMAKDHKNLSVTLIESCFIGMNAFLFVGEPSDVNYLYGQIKMSLEKGANECPIAVLSIIANHAHFMKNLLHEHYEWWITNLFQKWNKESETFVSATEAICKEVSNVIDPYNPRVLHYFIYELCHMLSHYKIQKRISALYGLAHFAKYAKRAKFNFNDILLNNNLNPKIDKDQYDNKNLQPAYAVCLSHFAANLDEWKFNEGIVVLKKTLVSLIENYADASPWLQKDTVRDIGRCLTTVENKFLTDHLPEVLYQGLLRSCAHLLFVDVQLLDRNLHSYQDFIPVWVKILTLGRNGSYDDREKASIIAHQFISVFLMVVNRLDYHLETENACSDPRFSLKARSPRDFQILINLVDLFADIVPEIDFNPFLADLPEFIINLINLSVKNPLVSAFYKAISSALEMTASLDLLDNIESQKLLITDYLQQVVKCIDIYSGELQLSCLRLILRAPVGFVQKTSNVFAAAIRLGSGCLDILQDCVESLTKYIPAISEESASEILDVVLPELDIFLQSTQSSELFYSGMSELKSRGKVKRRLAGSRDGQLVQLQRQILHLLGRLDSDLASKIVKAPSVWPASDVDTLVYTLPLRDQRPKLKLEKLLPRILKLATGAGERPTRIAACEFVYNVLLIAVEDTKHWQSNKSTFLFRILMENALTLAVDADRVVQDLFHHLVIQITHYFADSRADHTSAAELIKILMEGVSHQYNPAIRDFSTVCVRELLVSAKESNNNKTVRALIRYILDFSLHPHRWYRYGAALAFNALHQILCNDKVILNTYWFQLVWHMFRNFEMCDNASPDELKQVTLALKNNLLHPLCNYAEFNQTDSKRRVPLGVTGSTLWDLAVYIFHLCQSKCEHVRECARYCLTRVVTNVANCGSLKSFVEKKSILFKMATTQEKIISLELVIWLLEENAFADNYLDSVVITNLESLISQYPKAVFGLIKLCYLTNSAFDPNFIEKIWETTWEIAIPESEESEFCKNMLQFLIKFPHLFKTSTERLIRKILDYKTPTYLLIVKTITEVDKSVKIPGSDLLSAIFENLFITKGQRSVASPIELSKKVYFKKLLAFVLEHQESAHHLLNFLSDSSKVETEENFCMVITKGQYFLELFQDVLFCWLVRYPKDTVSVLLKIDDDEKILRLMGVLRYLQQNRNNIDTNVHFQTEMLFQIDTWLQTNESTDKKNEMLDFILAACQVVPRNYGCLLNYEKILQWTTTLLLPDETLSRTIFQLLPYLSTPGEQINGNLLLKNALFNYQRNCQKENYSKSIFKDLVFAFELTGSIILLKFLLDNFIEFNETNLNFNIQFSDNVLINCVFYMHNFILTENPDMTTLNVAGDILYHMVKINKATALQYFTKHLINLESILSSKQITECLLIKKIISLKLIEIIYFLMDNADRENLENLTKKEIYKNIMRIASNPIKSDNHMEMTRKYNCACVNFMCIMLTNSGRANYVSNFIFKENIFKSIIPIENFQLKGIEVQELRERKQFLTLIKTAKKHILPPTSAFAASSTLFESTLNEDVRKFDFSDVYIRKNENLNQIQVDIEFDFLNQLEFMPSLCAVVQFLTENDIPHDGLPCWLKFCLNLCNKNDCSLNELLVGLKLIINMSEHAQPFAEKITGPILKTIAKLLSESGLNYFMLDLLLMILNWPHVSGDSNVKINIIIGLVDNKNFNDTTKKTVIRYVMNVVTKLISVWKDDIESNELSNILINRLNDTNDWKDYITLSVANSILANKISISDNHSLLLDWAVNVLMKEEGKKFSNFSMAAQVSGMILNDYSKKFADKDLIKKFYIKISTLSDFHCINAFYDVSQFFIDIVDEYAIDKFIMFMRKETVDMQKKILEMILNYLSNFQIAESNLNNLEKILVTTLPSNALSIQELSLKIILKLPNGQNLSNEVIKLCKHPNGTIKKLSCQVLLEIYKNHTDDEVKSVLLKCHDVDEIFEKFLNTFPARESSTREVFFIFNELFTNHDFLKYSTKILLNLPKLSLDFNQTIFEHPLIKDCEYEKLNILDSWRAQSTMPPLFAPSVAGELNSYHQTQPTSSLAMELRATAQTLLYPPTIENNSDPSTQDNGVFRKPKAPLRSYPFRNDKESFIRKAVEKNKMEEKAARDRLRERGKRVTLHREYRIGHYPDVQISHKDFLSPLHTLIMDDLQTARSVFVLLIRAILNEDDLHLLEEHFNYILENSENTSLIAAIFELGLGQINFDSQLVLLKANSCGLLSLGSLIIEQSINLKLEEMHRNKRAKGFDDFWLDLAQVYQKLGETDALKGVFLDKCLVTNEEKEAIISESAKDWSVAAANYRKILASECATEKRVRFYSQAYWECLAHLGDWDHLNKYLQQAVQHDDATIWEDCWCADAALPWHLIIQLKLNLPQNKRDFCKYLEKCLKDSNREILLNNKFSWYLALMSTLSNDKQNAIHYLEQTFQRFIQNWRQINNWEEKLKVSKLDDLQILYDVNSLIVENEHKLLPKNTHNLINWDLRLSIKQCNENENEIYLFNLFLRFARAAAEQDNYNLAQKFIDKIEQRFCFAQNQTSFLTCRNFCELLKAKQEIGDRTNRVTHYLEAWKQIESNKSCSKDVTYLIDSNRVIMSAVSTVLSLAKVDNIDVNQISTRPHAYQTVEQYWVSCFQQTLNAMGDSFETEKGRIYFDYYLFLSKQSNSIDNQLMSILKSMSYGNVKARHMFGRVLSQNPVDSEANCDKVPVWMFLMWRHQLLTMIDLKIVQGIILRMANEYPNALKIELRLIKQFLDKQKRDVADFVNQIWQIVFRHSIEDKFFEEISRIGCPMYLLKNMLAEITHNFNKPNLIDDVVSLFENSNEAYKDIQPYKEGFFNFKSNRDPNSLYTLIRSIEKDINKISNFLRLEAYSLWLSQFHWLNHTTTIEVPGQYDAYVGNTPPCTSKHILVASVQTNVIVLSSKCRPIKITLTGSDAKPYSFLVKIGDDLRQDARVQQLCRHMNNKFQEARLPNRLSVDTYNVIPLTVNCGLVEWVENTKSIRNLLEPDAKFVEEKKRQIEFFGGINPLIAHKNGYLKKSIDDTVAQFHLRAKAFRSDLLREKLFRLTQSVEQFVAFRTNFGSSLAAMCIAHWLLGVGDRHLENILISLKTGRVFGIDFGFAFGAATELIPLPELPPLRLTSQILSVMRPMEASGWIKQGMISCLRTVRSDSESLIALLDVFVTDPCVAWEEAARRLTKEHNGDDENIVEWSARRKVAAVVKKLQGGNPTNFIEDDLRSGHGKKEFFEKCLEILRGRSFSLRRTFNEDNLNAEDQVDCLIDLSTDSAILAYTYVGWEPWL